MAEREKNLTDDDYPASVRRIRKSLMPQLLISARRKGKYAVLRYDRLIVEDFNSRTNKTKRRVEDTFPKETSPRKTAVSAKRRDISNQSKKNIANYFQ